MAIVVYPYLLQLLVVLACHSVPLHSLVFNYKHLGDDTASLIRKGNVSYQPEGSIELTLWDNNDLRYSASRLYHKEPLLLWNATTGKAASFNCSFQFRIRAYGSPMPFGDGLAFLLLNPVNFELPDNGKGSWLGLFNASNNGSASNQIVAVEFDTFVNPKFLDPNANHIGVDVNNIISSILQPNLSFDMRSSNSVYAWIDYSSSVGLLVVYASNNSSLKPSVSLISYKLNLSQYLPETVLVGFSSATGNAAEYHTILSWIFNSTAIELEQPKRIEVTQGMLAHQKGDKIRLIACLVSGFSILPLVSVGVFLVWRKWSRGPSRDTDRGLSSSTYAPRNFTYRQLSIATKHFSSTQLLGRGGFGHVYKGVLPEDGTEVAVKRISQKSKQGFKEFLAEVKVTIRWRPGR